MVQGKSQYQWGLKIRYFDELMKLPDDVEITHITFNWGYTMKRKAQPISKELAKSGLTYLRTGTPSSEAAGFMSGLSRLQYAKNMAKICKEIGLDRKNALVRRIEIKCGESKGSFSKTSKWEEDNEGKKHRTMCLGLYSWEGSENEVIRGLGGNATKFQCTYETHAVRTVTCKEVNSGNDTNDESEQ